MKSVVIEKPGSFQINDLPYPHPGEGEVTLDVKACCVCGTDRHLLDGEFKGVVYPLIPGHEFSGVVAEVGAKVTHVKPGDRVAVEPFIACGYCFYCKSGKTNHCLNGMVIGHTKSAGMKLDGGFSEQVVVSVRNLIPLADDVSFEAGSFIANLRNDRLHAPANATSTRDESVGFWDRGERLAPGGTCEKIGAATVVVTGRTKSRLDVALGMGIDETVVADDSQEENLRRIAPRGFDAIFETTGVAPICRAGI